MYKNKIDAGEEKAVCEGEKCFILLAGKVVTLIFLNNKKEFKQIIIDSSINKHHKRMQEIVFKHQPGPVKDNSLRELFTLCGGYTPSR